MLDDDPVTRELIATALGRTIDRTVREHIAGITQEAPLTSRIGHALEKTLNDQSILGRRVTVVTQDVPDRGPGALEKAIGADLYVGIEVKEGGSRETKGLLVQAKLSRNLHGSSEDLRSDCRDMTARSTAGYVWIYGSNGVRILDAHQILASDNGLRDMPARRATTVFARVLECTEGDPDIGLPAHGESRAELRSSLGRMLERLRAQSAFGVLVT